MPFMNEPAISIILPCYNEAENLPVLAAEIEAAMREMAGTYEVLFVDAGSTDDTQRVLAALAAADSRRRVLRSSRNCGQSAALAAGFDAARGGVLVTLDADLQNDPGDISLLLDALEGVELAAGIRVRRQDSWVRRVSSRLANGVRSRALDDATPDTGCSLKAFRRDVAVRLPRFVGMHRFLPALVQMDGGRVRHVPVRHRPRLHGKTKYNVRNRLVRGLVDLLGVLWLKRRWIDRRVVTEVNHEL